MGYDALGSGREHAIRTGVHPRQSTEESIAAFQRAFRSWGISIDWSREISSHDPSYYRWTQWIFLRFFERGLAYRKEAAVNWCPHDQTVLANEQVIDGHCERCGAASSYVSSSNGSSRSPMPTGCSRTSTRSTGPSTSRRCSATGSAAAPAPR